MFNPRRFPVAVSAVHDPQMIMKLRNSAVAAVELMILSSDKTDEHH